MNEFDSFVRIKIKPLAYVRYGDDFIIISGRKTDAVAAEKLSKNKLNQLGLTINSKQDQTVRSWQGLHFLGHVINENGSTIIMKTQKLMLKRLVMNNISSYSSLKHSKEIKRVLPWLIDL